MTDQHRGYSRWTRGQDDVALRADILHGPGIVADVREGLVRIEAAHWQALTPDEARLIGVRLIEAATLADGDRAIREHPTT